MSSVAFGALTTRRENSASGTSKSVQPPGLNSYIDILTALVPAEVLAIHATILSIVATSNSQGQTQITDPTTARWAFWLLLALSAVLFVLGRGAAPATPGNQDAGWRSAQPQWEWQDAIRLLIPPIAFVGWTMLEPVSAWNAVAPHVSAGMRVLLATVGAVALAAVTKALTTHADKKPPPGSLSRDTMPQSLDGEQSDVRAQGQAAELLRRAELAAASASTVTATLTDRAAEAPQQRPAIGRRS
jgi:hypothetical protein